MRYVYVKVVELPDGANQPDQLTDKLRQFHETLTEAEKANFKLLLGLAAGGLAPAFRKPPVRVAWAWRVASPALARKSFY